MLSPPAWGHIPHVRPGSQSERERGKAGCHPHPIETFPVPQMSVGNYSEASNAQGEHENVKSRRQKGLQFAVSWVWIWGGSETWFYRENREGAKVWWSIPFDRVPRLNVFLKPHT